MNNTLIRQAVAADIDAICDAYDELLKHEAKFGNYSNWQMGIYPTIAVPAQHIPSGSMFVIEDYGQVCGSMVLNQEQAAEYVNIDWEYKAPDNAVLVVHTLCIAPSKAGRGFGGQMVSFAKKFGIEHGCEVIRMDTYAYNEPAKRLYLKNGFRIAGHGTSFLEGLIREEMVYLECALGL